MLRRPSYKQFLNQTKEVQSAINLSFADSQYTHPSEATQLELKPKYSNKSNKSNKQKGWDHVNINVIKYLPDDPRTLRHTYAQESFKRSGLNQSFNKNVQICSPYRDNDESKFRKTAANTYPRSTYREPPVTQAPIFEKPIEFSRTYVNKPSEGYSGGSNSSFTKSIYHCKSSTRLQLKNDGELQKSMRVDDRQNGRMTNKMGRHEDKIENSDKSFVKSHNNITIYNNKENVLQKKQSKICNLLEKSQHSNKQRSKSPISNTQNAIKPFVPIQFKKKTSNDPPEEKIVPREPSQSQIKRFSSPITKNQKPPKSQNQIIQQQKQQVVKIKQLKLQDFSLGKKLGQGRFGIVWVAVHKSSGSVFALKKIQKSTIKGNFLVQQFILQVKIQSLIQNPFIVKIYGIFCDKEHIYLLLEYLEGGTLYSMLKMNGGKLSEEEVSNKIKMICGAVNCLHEKGIAHRDIKPENIIITNEICKLADFGWATCCDQRRRTYCGTTDYVAPEIIEGLQYDMSVDLWCIGVLAYELLSGRAPFYHISRQQTFNKIKNVDSSSIKYPDYFSFEAIDFISRLIKKSPNERMIMPEALRHPFITKYQ